MASESGFNPVPVLVHVVAIAVGLYLGFLAMDAITPDLPDDSRRARGRAPRPRPARWPATTATRSSAPTNLAPALAQLDDQLAAGQGIGTLHIEPGSLDVETSTRRRDLRARRRPAARPDAARRGDRRRARPRRDARRRRLHGPRGDRARARAGTSSSTSAATIGPPPWTYGAPLDGAPLSSGRRRRSRSAAERRASSSLGAVAGAFVAADLSKRYGSTEALRGRLARGRRGRDRRAARAERRRQVDAGEDRLRPRAAERRRRRGSAGTPAGTPRGPGRDRLPRRALPLPRLGERRRGAAPAPAARRLGAAARPSAPSCSSWSASATPRRGGSSAMSKGMQQRLGIAQALVGEPAPAAARRADERPRPGRAAGRARAARARSARAAIAVLLSSHLLGEVELVCDRVAILVDGEIVERGTPAELARPRGRRDRDGVGDAAARGRRARGRAADRRRARRRGRAGLRRAGAREHARGRLPRGRRGGARMSATTRADARPTPSTARSSASRSPRACAGGCSRSSSCSPLVFLVALRARASRSPSTRSTSEGLDRRRRWSTSRRSSARRSSAWRCSRPCSSARCSPSS